MTALLFILLLLSPLVAYAAGVEAADLQCEHLREPVGIDVTVPRLSWRMEDPAHARGRRQSAYRVLVSSSREVLAKDNGDLWDSGKVSSNQSHLIPYAGKRLVSLSTCHWKVKVWTEEGRETPWSAPSPFTIGPLDASDWQGPWMTSGEDPETKQPVPAVKHLWFRRQLELSAEPVNPKSEVKKGIVWWQGLW